MPRISEIQLVKRAEQPALSIRKRARVEELPQLIGGSYGKLAQYVESVGVMLSDVPFTAYQGEDMKNLDVEIGFPMPERVDGSGEISSATIPGGLFIFCMYQGAYSGTCTAYEEMIRFAAENGLVIDGAYYEHYYNGPEYPEEQLLTRLVLPVKKVSG